MISRIKMVIADETKWVAWGPCRVLQIFGYNNHTADNYIQFFASPIVTNGDVPAAAALFAPAVAPFSWNFTEPLWLPELLVGISSSEVNYTALTNTGVDMTMLVESDFLVTSNTTVVGDLTTGVLEKQIWSEANGASTPKKLLRLDFKNNLGATAYPFISPRDTNLLTSSDLMPLGPVADSVTESFFFNGLSPSKLSVAGTSYVKGLTVIASAAGSVNGGALVGTNSFNIRGIYDI